MARPKLSPEVKLMRASITVPPEQWAVLQALGRARRQSTSAVIRQFIDEGLARRPREVERATSESVAVA